MFFHTKDMDVELLTVIELEWDRVNAKAGYRPFHCISFRLLGGADILSDGRETVCIGEGEISFTPAEYDFSKRAEKGRIIAIHFTSSTPLPQEVVHFRPRNQDFFRQEFQKILTVWSEKKLGYEYESKMHFYRIVLEIEREWAQQSPSVTNEKLSAALQYIHTHCSEGGVSVEKLSRMCGMSDTYFRRLFVAEFGMTPKKYINHLRMTQLRELLQSNYYSIEEIAEICGFNNVNYFSLFVKKETGLPPSALRAQLLNPGKGQN